MGTFEDRECFVLKKGLCYVHGKRVHTMYVYIENTL